MLIYVLKVSNHGGQGQLFGPELNINVTPSSFIFCNDLKITFVLLPMLKNLILQIFEKKM
jgi:hypothetical protein